MQHHHVQPVAFDPFAAIDQPAQLPKLPIDRTPNASSIAWTELI